MSEFTFTFRDSSGVDHTHVGPGYTTSDSDRIWDWIFTAYGPVDEETGDPLPDTPENRDIAYSRWAEATIAGTDSNAYRDEVQVAARSAAESVPPIDSAPQWVQPKAYVVDERATYLDVIYVCIQAHTSQAGWEPPNVPALWNVA